MFYRFSLNQLLLRLATVLIVSGLLGLLLGIFWQTLFVVTLAMLAWHYRHLVSLVSWLWQNKAITPPEGKGSWSHVYDGIYRRVKRYRSKQKALNKIIKRYRDGAEALPDAAVVLNEDYTIRWCNKRASALLGIRWPSDEGQRIDNLIRSPIFSKYLEKKQFNAILSLPSPLSAELQLELRFMSYGDDGLLLLARDVSQISRLQEMRRDFVANVSHELKTPLTVVRGYVEMIQSADNDFSPQWQQAFNTIEMQVTRMDRLVEQLLVLSRVESVSDNQVKRPVNVVKLIQQLAADAQWLNQDKQHKIELDITAQPVILGVETELKSAFSNLIANAIAYTPANGNIKVRWFKAGGKLCFSVDDNGNGIKPEHLNRLTERFYRIDKSRSRDTGGSGLGLSIVKHVLQHHNAELSITSEWGKGSCFTIAFEPHDVSSS